MHRGQLVMEFVVVEVFALFRNKSWWSGQDAYMASLLIKSYYSPTNARFVVLLPRSSLLLTLALSKAASLLFSNQNGDFESKIQNMHYIYYVHLKLAI